MAYTVALQSNPPMSQLEQLFHALEQCQDRDARYSLLTRFALASDAENQAQWSSFLRRAGNDLLALGAVALLYHASLEPKASAIAQQLEALESTGRITKPWLRGRPDQARVANQSVVETQALKYVCTDETLTIATDTQLSLWNIARWLRYQTWNVNAILLATVGSLISGVLSDGQWFTILGTELAKKGRVPTEPGIFLAWENTTEIEAMLVGKDGSTWRFRHNNWEAIATGLRGVVYLGYWHGNIYAFTEDRLIKTWKESSRKWEQLATVANGDRVVRCWGINQHGHTVVTTSTIEHLGGPFDDEREVTTLEFIDLQAGQTIKIDWKNPQDIYARWIAMGAALSQGVRYDGTQLVAVDFVTGTTRPLGINSGWNDDGVLSTDTLILRNSAKELTLVELAERAPVKTPSVRKFPEQYRVDLAANGPAQSLEFACNGTVVVTTQLRGSIPRSYGLGWDVSSGQRVFDFVASPAVLSIDRTELYEERIETIVRVWNLATQTFVREDVIGQSRWSTPLGLKIELDSTTGHALIASGTDHVTVYEMTTGQVRENWKIAEGKITSLECENGRVFTKDFAGNIVVWNSQVPTFEQLVERTVLRMDRTEHFLVLVRSKELQFRTLDGTLKTRLVLNSYPSSWVETGLTQVMVANRDGTLQWWNLETATCLHTIKAHGEGDLGLLSLSKQFVASCGSDRSLKIWDLAAHTCVREIAIAGKTNGKIWSYSQYIAVSTEDSLALWDWQTGKLVQCLSGFPYNPEIVGMWREILVVACLDVVRLWDVEKNHYKELHGVGSSRVLTDDGMLVSVGSIERWWGWDILSGKIGNKREVPVWHRRSLGFNNDRSLVVRYLRKMWGTWRGLQIWTTSPEHLVREIALDSEPNRAVFVNDQVWFTVKHKLYRWTLNEVVQCAFISEDVTALTVSHEESLVFSGTITGEVVVTNALNQVEITTLTTGSRKVCLLEYLALGRFVIAVTEDQCLSVWSAKDWKLATVLKLDRLPTHVASHAWELALAYQNGDVQLITLVSPDG